MTNEQWKEGGNCNECRRKKYCTKACTKHRKMRYELISQAIAKKIFKENNQ